jgi:tetratricopeptide (TPR) repeat protein
MSKDSWETQVNELKGSGNKSFSANDSTTALTLYSQALALFPSVLSAQTHKETKGILLCNRGFCQLKKTPADYDQALSDSKAALQVYPSYSKAWFRKALAHEGRAKSRGASSMPISFFSSLFFSPYIRFLLSAY